jgi:hypothetical protein
MCILVRGLPRGSFRNSPDDVRRPGGNRKSGKKNPPPEEFLSGGGYYFYCYKTIANSL